MHRREVLAGIAASFVTASAKEPQAPERSNAYFELKLWRLHNSAEDQAARLADYLEAGLSPALSRAGGKLAGAFSNVIGEDGPYYVTLVEYASLKAFQDVLAALRSDAQHELAVEKLSSGIGMPFVRVESSIMRAFDGMPRISYPDMNEKRPPRIFEFRTYESQSWFTLGRKVTMFNSGEIELFQRLNMRPVFFGETIAGPRQPNLKYMLSYDDLASRDNLWHAFVNDPVWKKLSSEPQFKDSEIVSNISNVILRPLAFSAIR